MARDFLGSVSPGYSTQCVDDVLLVVSELVTNALRHAGGVSGLRLIARPDVVEVVVEDPSSRFPVERTHDLRIPGGLGWPLVCHLAREVTVEPRTGGGKVIRAAVAGAGAPPECAGDRIEALLPHPGSTNGRGTLDAGRR